MDKACNGCGDVPCEHTIGGGSSAPGRSVTLDLSDVALGPIPAIAWSEAVQIPTGQIPSVECFVTLDGARGTTIAKIESQFGESILHPGVPSIVTGPISVRVSGADRTSFATLLVAPWPMRTPGTPTFRDLGKRVTTVATLTPANAKASGFVIHPGSQSLVVQAFCSVAGDVTMAPILDAGNGTVTYGTPVTFAVAAGVATSNTPTLTHEPHAIWINPTAGPGTGWLRVLQPLGGS